MINWCGYLLIYIFRWWWCCGRAKIRSATDFCNRRYAYILQACTSQACILQTCTLQTCISQICNYLTDIHLIDVHLTGMHLTGVHLTGVHLIGPHRYVLCRRAPHRLLLLTAPKFLTPKLLRAEIASRNCVPEAFPRQRDS